MYNLKIHMGHLALFIRASEFQRAEGWRIIKFYKEGVPLSIHKTYKQTSYGFEKTHYARGERDLAS